MIIYHIQVCVSGFVPAILGELDVMEDSCGYALMHILLNINNYNLTAFV